VRVGVERIPAPAPAAGILGIAARIANPYVQTDLSRVDAAAMQAAATLLERQKVSFIPIAARYGDVLNSTPLAEFVRRDVDRYHALRAEFERIRVCLAGAGIETMVFKSAGGAPSFQYLTSNLDVLVPDGRARAARRLLVDLGYVELLNIEEPQKFLFRRFPGDGTSLAFHLHEVVGWGVPFLDNRPVWAHARHPVDDPAILIPGPSEALLITLAHWFYEDKALSLGNLFLTAQALRSMEEALGEPASHARRRGWEEGFWGGLCVFDEAWKRLFGEVFLSGEQRSELDRAPARYAVVRNRLLPLVRYGEHDVAAAMPFRASKGAYYRKVMRDRGRNPERKLLDVFDTLLWAVRWKLHVRSQPALLVTLSGCDGSGKSLQAERLRRVFETCDVRVRLVWARGASSRGAGAVMRAGRKVLGGGAPAAPAGDAGGGPRDEARRFDERQRRLRHPFARWVFSVVYALDLVGPCVWQTRRAMLTGNVVICDRHICDALVDFALFTGTDPANPPFALKVLHSMVPRPNLGVLLDVESDEALRRKPEEGSTTHLDVARRMFLELAKARRMMVMPAGSSADEIQRLVARAALVGFYERYGTLINWLLRSNPGQMNRRDDAS
jgi:thymidylate kinase